MKKKKYATGGDIVRNYIETPNEALVDNDIAMARAIQKAESNPLAIGTQLFGNMALSYASSMGGGAANIMQGISSFFATGGTVAGKGVEVEGNEVIETPDGTVSEVKGPSHENGGVDMVLPFGTEVYSKRLTGPDGKTMAERKKYRENRISKLESLVRNNPTDSTLKKTLEKTKKNFELQDQFDTSKMNFVKSLAEGVSKMATGGTIQFPLLDDSFLEAANGLTFGGNNPNIDYAIIDKTFDNTSVSDNASLSGPTDYTPVSKATASTGNTWKDALSSVFGGSTGVTLGDSIGLAGDVVSTFGPMRNTLENRVGDQPNVNYFEDFGQDALSTIDDSKGYIAGQRDKALMDSQAARSGSIRRNRNSARSVNTQRALDLATDMAANRQQVDIYDAFTKQMQSIFSQEAQLENQRDQAVMTGEAQRDMADRQDRDNFFSQMAQDIATKGEGLRKIGSDVNQIKSRNTTQKTLNQMYDNYKINAMTGDIKFVATQDVQANGDKYKAYGITPQNSDTYFKNIANNTWSWDGDTLIVTATGKEVQQKDIK